MTRTLDPVFAAALRRELVALPARRPSRRRGVLLIVATVGALTAGTVTAVAGLLPIDKVAAPPMAPPVIVNGVGPGRVPLPPAPDGATYVMVELACFDGTYCGTLPGDGTSRPETSGTTSLPHLVERIQLPLTRRPDPDNPQGLPQLDSGRGVPIDVQPGVHWRLYAAYSDRRDPRQAPLGDGRVAGLGLEVPELLPAETTDGKPGWISYSALLDHANPQMTASGVVQDPLPVYANDGTTVIGEADVSRPAR